MISFDDFVWKWYGVGCDFDGYYGDQCMDLMHQYVLEVLGITDRQVLAAPTAAQVYTNFNNVHGHELFTKIDNTPTGVPQKGDIIFWGKPFGYYFNTTTQKYEYAGHVALFHDGDINGLKSFDQNYPTGSFPHKQYHNYNGCLGWLRKK